MESSSMSNLNNRRKHPFLSRIRSFLTYEEVYGKPVSFNEIISLIKSLPIEYWVDIASKGRVLLEHYENDPKYQGILLHYLCPQSILEVEIKTTDDEDRFFFHRTQFLALLRLALLHGCSPEHKEIDDEERREIVARCLLGISSLIYETEETKSELSFDINNLMKKLTFDFRKQLDDSERTYLMNLFAVYHNHLTENLGSLIAKCKDMLFDIPNDPMFIPQGAPITILSEILGEEMGLSIPEYASLTFGLFAKYVSPEGIFKKESHFPVDKDTHFSNSSINKSAITKYFDAVCQSRSEFLERQGNRIDDPSAINDFHSFMLKPLVHLDDSSKCYPVSLTYLQRLLGDAFTWVIAGGELRPELRNYWGQTFEYYCHKICQRIEAKSRIRPKYFHDVEYESPYGRKRSCDAILIYGNSAVMMEFKLKSPKLIDTIINRDFDSLIADIKNAYIEGEDGYKATKQIDESIRCIRNGELVLPGINPHSIGAYYPVVVTFQAWPLGPLIYELIRMLVQREGILRQSSYIAPLEVWSCEEFEYVESILTTKVSSIVALPDLIRDKLFGPYVNLPIYTFLADRFSGNFPKNEYIEMKRDEMLGIIKETLSLTK